MQIEPQIYIGTTRLDLYPDESITLNSSVKNYRDVSKVFTDFTQTFTIPASDTNNAVMEHWYNQDITTSFNPLTRRSGRIELNGIPYKTGVFSMDGVDVKNGRADSYKITFYGDLRSLADLFKDDKLTDLDLSAHQVNYSDYQTGLTSTLHSGDVVIPLMTAQERWVYDDPTTVSDLSFGIKYESGTGQEGGVKHVDVKPAIKVKNVIDAIESKYGVTFNSTFFGSADFAKIFVWGHNNPGRAIEMEKDYEKIVQTGVTDLNTYAPSEFTFQRSSSTDPSAYFFQNNTTDATGAPAYIDYQVSITPNTTGSVDSSEITYKVLVWDQLNSVIESEYGGTGSTVVTTRVNSPTATSESKRIVFKIRSDLPLDYTLTIQADDDAITTQYILTGGDTCTPNKFYFTDAVYTEPTTGVAETVKGNLPRQKVSEFLAGLTKMFNLVIVPTSATTFDVEPWDTYLAAGSTIDFNKYVDIANYSVMPVDVFGEIDFKYSSTDTVLAKNFREQNNGVGYGDLETTIVDASGNQISANSFEVEVPFTNILFERLYNTSTGALTNLIVGLSIDKSFEPVSENPVLFYRVGTKSISGTPIGTRDRLGDTLTSTSTYNLCYQFNTEDDSYTGSLNFGSEINPLTGNAGGATDPSLYITYWEDYITDLYDLQSRRFKIKAVLPVGFLITLGLNDKIQIGTGLYRINELRVNLRTGEATLDILNIID